MKRKKRKLDEKEFLYHLKTIQELIKKPHVRIILMHPPYTLDQQNTIDSICKVSKKIIGQIERKPPLKDAAEEVGRILQSHKEPFVPAEELQYVILGKVTQKD